MYTQVFVDDGPDAAEDDDDKGGRGGGRGSGWWNLRSGRIRLETETGAGENGEEVGSEGTSGWTAMREKVKWAVGCVVALVVAGQWVRYL